MEIWPIMAPHTPDLLSSWKSGSSREMIGAFVRMRQDLLSRSAEPFSAVIAYTPGWQVRHITLVDLSAEHRSSRDFSGFGHHYQYDPPGAPEIGRILIEAGRNAKMAMAEGIHGVDHAISIPLFFLLPEGETPVLPLSQSLSGVRQASLLGEVLRQMKVAGRKKLLLLVSGIWSQNTMEMARGQDDPLIIAWADKILQGVFGHPVPDWNFLPGLNREVLDRLDAPGRLRELHLLKGLGVKGGRIWAKERIRGLIQVLASFDPIVL